MERKKLAELVSRYKLHPTFRDIYVEGPFDKHLLKWVLRELGKSDVAIYDINTIEVSNSADSPEEGGARGRVLSLVRDLERELGPDRKTPTGIIDGDFDFALGITRPEKLLLVTDYSSMEMYAFSVSCLQKFLTVGLGIERDDVASLLDTYSQILREVFSLRLANHTLRTRLSWLDFTDSCSVRGDKLSFDRADFVDRLLNKNGATGKRAVIEDAMLQHSASLATLDPRLTMHGHDFSSLVAFHWATTARRRGFRDRNSLPTVLIMSLDSKSLAEENLFVQLLERLT